MIAVLRFIAVTFFKIKTPSETGGVFVFVKIILFYFAFLAMNPASVFADFA